MARIFWTKEEADLLLDKLRRMIPPGKKLICSGIFLIREVEKLQAEFLPADRRRPLGTHFKTLGPKFEELQEWGCLELRHKIQYHEYVDLPASPEVTSVAAPTPTPPFLVPSTASTEGHQERLLPRLMAEIGELLGPSIIGQLGPVVQAMVTDEVSQLREEFQNQLRLVLGEVRGELALKVDKTIGGIHQHRMSIHADSEPVSAANNSGSGLIATRPSRKRVIYATGREKGLKAMKPEYLDHPTIELDPHHVTSNTLSSSLVGTLKAGNFDLCVVHGVSHTVSSAIQKIVPGGKYRFVRAKSNAVRETIDSVMSLTAAL